MQRKATSKDVADLAGVSRTAVSLVLNGHGEGNIAPEKQALIRAAARTLNYAPHAVAVSLQSRRSSMIGVITDQIATSAHAGMLLRGASDAAVAAGYLLLVIDTQRDPDQEVRAYDVLRNQQVDGLLFAAMSLRPYAPPSLVPGGPAVLANCYDPDDRVPAFVPDEIGGSRAVTNHLIEFGHRDIAMISGSHDAVAAELREQGFREAMTAAGLSPRAPMLAGWEIDKGYAAAMQVLTGPGPLPTAIVCANDRAAVGVMLAAGALGLSVPRDLSVVGYDDDDNVAPYLVPALTTVRLPHREMGEEAMRVVLHAVAEGGGSGRPGEPAGAEPATVESAAGPDGDPERVPRTLLECPLVVRDSVAPPR
ncbi:MAG: LacI family DNA-binding transcriptional regulator [Micropruina sp.]|uniref:LacI family DNA-binding transcriptional regulator n=1 Tax=Micropruina sp. TaxID=2737536 RepID=UPI0039E22DA2